jgi:small subunit ribosomal protein S16
MAVRLRLRKTGTRNKPCFRIVVADARSPRDGRFIENLGYYDPRRSDERLDLERAEYWLSVGAQASETVESIIKRARDGKSLTAPEKVIPAPMLSPKPPPVEEAPAEEAAAEEAPAEEAAAEEAPAEEAAAEEAPAEEAEEEAKA